MAEEANGQAESAAAKEIALEKVRSAFRERAPKEEPKAETVPQTEGSSGEGDAAVETPKAADEKDKGAPEGEEPKDERVASAFAKLAREKRKLDLERQEARAEVEREKQSLQAQVERLRRFESIAEVLQKNPEAGLDKLAEIYGVKDKLNYDELTKQRLSGPQNRELMAMQEQLQAVRSQNEQLIKRFEETEKREQEAAYEREIAGHKVQCEQWVKEQNSGQIPRYPLIEAFGISGEITDRIIEHFNENKIELTYQEAANTIEAELRAAQERFESVRSPKQNGLKRPPVSDPNKAPQAKRAIETSDGPTSLGNRNAVSAPSIPERELSLEEGREQMKRRLLERKAARMRDAQ